jgi:hypothetical protein
VEGEIDDICQEILSLLGDVLLKNCQHDDEATVFYLKMMGDYLRYLAEVTEKEKRKTSADKACDAYVAGGAAAVVVVVGGGGGGGASCGGDGGGSGSGGGSCGSGGSGALAG